MDDFDLMHFEIDEKRLEEMRNGGGEIVDDKDADECEGGACKI